QLSNTFLTRHQSAILLLFPSQTVLLSPQLQLQPQPQPEPTNIPNNQLPCQLSDHNFMITTTKAGFPAAQQQQQQLLITKSLSEICSIPDETYSWETPRRFSGYLKRLQLILNHFLRSENHSTSIQTSLKGISSDLIKSSETLLLYRKKSKIYVLINCKSLCLALQETAISIGKWLALLDSALLDHNNYNPELHKKVSDLSTDMKKTQFKVTENEERVYCTLQKEGQVRQTSKAVQSGIIMDLARALGTEPGNLGELEKQIKLLKNDIVSSNSIAERRILMSLERIFDNWSIEPNHAAGGFDVDFEEDAQIQPFRNFICPLTKEVMKNPVVLESSQTYEKTAIQYWFDRCIEDGRDPTCPVTGQVLKSLEQKPNIGLAGAIEEWVNRNSNGSNLRSKSLLVLLSMSKDEESKLKMLEDGMTKLAIRSLNIERSEKEREYAVKLLLEFSKDEAYCAKIASEKGALVLLSTMAGNLEYPSLSYLAEEVLKKVEKVEDNVQHLASAGRFEPLLSRLCKGSNDIRIEMASLVGKMDLTHTSKEQIARQGAKILVDMLHKPEGRMESLQALYNLSTLDDNATILVDSGVLIPLTNILFNVEDDFSDLKELAVSIIANIVSKSGHWELASVNKEGFSLQSEAIVYSIIQLLPHASPKGQVQVLQILSGIASSPQASESVATHIASGGGIKLVLPLLGHPEIAHRLSAFKLVRILSEKVSPILATELRASNSFPLLKDKLLDTQYTDGERYEATCILANLPLTDDEIKTILGTNLIGWIVSALKEYRGSSTGKTSRSTSLLVEGLLGLLLHYAKSRDQAILNTVQEYRLMTVFREQLSFSIQPRVKERAALGLKYLSEFGRTLNVSANLEPKRSRGIFSSLTLCGKPPKVPPTCPIHCTACGDDSLCLLKSNCIKPLINLLDDEDTNVQISAVQALSTVLDDGSHSPKRAVDELEELGVVDAVIALFKEVRTGELQERTIWMVERILRLENQNPQLSVDQTLVRALVEALKHGNANTKLHAQNALTNLKQLSGISGKISSQGQRPTNRH
ncbi:hypothetical protein AQUCO_00400378v1, partial [Aquilegia coerulea]